MEIIKRIFSLLFMIGLWSGVLLGCTSEEINKEGNRPAKEDEKLISMEIPITRAPNDATIENRISTARMIVLKSGYVRANKDLQNIPLGQSVIQLADSVPVGNVDFFLIVNEDASWNLNTLTKGSAYTTANLKTKMLTYSGSPQVDNSHHIPMALIYEGLEVKQDGTAYYGGTQITNWAVRRLIAKLIVNLNVTFGNTVGKEAISLIEAKVDSMPQNSFLSPQNYTGSVFFNSSGFIPATSPNTYVSNSTGFSAHFETYLPEYLVSDKNKFTFFSFAVNLAAGSAGSSTERVYKVVIGEGIGRMSNDSLYYKKAGTTNFDYYIQRNKQYTYDVALESYQYTSDTTLTIKAKVSDWGVIPTDSVDTGDYYLRVDPEVFSVPAAHSGSATAYKGTVNIETNYKDGWSASTTQNGGTVILQSNATNQPSGPLKFDFYSNTQGGSATITIKSGKDGKMAKNVKITRL